MKRSKVAGTDLYSTGQCAGSIVLTVTFSFCCAAQGSSRSRGKAKQRSPARARWDVGGHMCLAAKSSSSSTERRGIEKRECTPDTTEGAWAPATLAGAAAQSAVACTDDGGQDASSKLRATSSGPTVESLAKTRELQSSLLEPDVACQAAPTTSRTSSDNLAVLLGLQPRLDASSPGISAAQSANCHSYSSTHRQSSNMSTGVPSQSSSALLQILLGEPTERVPSVDSPVTSPSGKSEATQSAPYCASSAVSSAGMPARLLERKPGADSLSSPQMPSVHNAVRSTGSSVAAASASANPEASLPNEGSPTSQQLPSSTGQGFSVDAKLLDSLAASSMPAGSRLLSKRTMSLPIPISYSALSSSTPAERTAPLRVAQSAGATASDTAADSITSPSTGNLSLRLPASATALGEARDCDSSSGTSGLSPQAHCFFNGTTAEASSAEASGNDRRDSDSSRGASGLSPEPQCFFDAAIEETSDPESPAPRGYVLSACRFNVKPPGSEETAQCAESSEASHSRMTPMLLPNAQLYLPAGQLTACSADLPPAAGKHVMPVHSAQATSSVLAATSPRLPVCPSPDAEIPYMMRRTTLAQQCHCQYVLS